MFIAYAERGEAGKLSDELVARSLLGSEDLAQVLAFIGDAGGAIEALQVAAAEHSGSRSVFSMKINPAYDLSVTIHALLHCWNRLAFPTEQD
jgi:hypothetical protein